VTDTKTGVRVGLLVYMDKCELASMGAHRMAPTLLYCQAAMMKMKIKEIPSFTLGLAAAGRKTRTLHVHLIATECSDSSNYPLYSPVGAPIKRKISHLTQITTSLYRSVQSTGGPYAWLEGTSETRKTDYTTLHTPPLKGIATTVCISSTEPI